MLMLFSAIELVELQNKAEDLSCLPTLKMADIPTSVQNPEVFNISKCKKSNETFLFFYNVFRRYATLTNSFILFSMW